MRRVLLAFLALLFAAILGAGWYVYKKGFTRRWRNEVSEEFRKRGFEVSLRRLTLDPFRGLVAREMKIYDASDRRRLLAVIDEVQLGVNYANLARGEVAIDSLDLREATLALPVDPTQPQGAKVEVSRLNARLFLPLQQIYLAHAEAEVFGVQVCASGRLINPQEFRPRAAANAAPGKLAARVIEEIKALQFEAAPPVLSLTFSGDLAEPEKIAIDLALWGERIRRQSYVIRSLYLAAGFRDGVVDLKQLTATDVAGSLRASGSYRIESREAEVNLRSGLDLQSFAAAFRLAPQLGEMVFYSAPALEVAARAKFGDTPEGEAVGHAAIKKFAYRSVIFDGLSLDYSLNGPRWSARNVHLAHRSGEAHGDLLQIPGEFHARITSTLNPKALQPLFTGPALDALLEFEFRESPEIELEASGSEISREALAVNGRLKIGSASYRGVAAESMNATFRYADRALSISPFRVQRSEGTGQGGLLFDFKRDEVRLEKIHANVNPAEVALWIEPKLVKDVAPYRFRARPPNLLIDGVVHTKQGKSTRLAIDVDAPGGMDYTFLKRELHSPQIAGKLLFTSDRLKISELNGSLFGGRIRGGADISLKKEKPGHSASVEVENMDFASLTKLYFSYDGSQGRLTGRYDFSGRGDDARTMEGRGELSVVDGNVFAIPFLGPLSGILNTIVPGMGYNVARKGAATFTIQSGVIATNNLEVQGQGFSMFGGGKLFFLDDKMAFDMRINAQGLPGVLLFPVSKLFEYTADDKLSKPNWRPKILPKL
ncbi:MAG: AsmA-like C-terminal region-containing protein [Chthoniobacteraceae bacterium]